MVEPRSGYRFDRGARLTLAVIALVFVYAFVDLGYRFTLPSDGWEVSEADETGFAYFAYLRNISGSPSPLQPGDHVIAINGIPAEFRIVGESESLRAAWRTGAVIDYTVIRDGQEMIIPVTLKHWELGGWVAQQILHPVTLAGLLSNWILFVLALVVFLRRPDNLAAGPFLLITTTVFAGISLSETLPSGFTGWIDPLASFFRSVVSTILLTSLFPFAFIRFALVFPKPSALQLRFPWIPFAAGGIGFTLVVLFPTQIFSWLWFVLSLLLGVVLLVRNAFTMRDPVSRAQIRWGVGGIMAGMGTITVREVINTSGLMLIDENTFEIVEAIGTTMMGVMLAIGISRYRLFDIDVLIRRTLQYTLLTGLLALVYFGGVVILQGGLRGLTGETSSPLATVLTTLLMAALFNPLRRGVQEFIDRRFYRSKYDAEQALARFAAAARDEVDLERLATSILDVVDQTVRPVQASLWLRRREGR